MEVMEKVERLARMETRRKAWEAEYICKEVFEGIMIAVSKSGNEKMVRSILEMVVDTAIQESRVRDILTDIKEYRLESIILESMRKREADKDDEEAEDVGDKAHLQGDTGGGAWSCQVGVRSDCDGYFE